jgi:integrase
MAALDAWLEVRGHDAGALFGRAVRGGRVGERRLADEGVAVILRDWASVAGSVLFTPHDMRHTSLRESVTPAPTWRRSKRWSDTKA